MKFIKINPSIFVLLIIFLYTGMIIEGILFILCIILHELGHLFFLSCFHIKIDKITISFFGGELKTNLKYQYLSFFQKLLIYLGGILVNIIIIFILFNIYYFNKFNKVIDILIQYNQLFILFNLLPIYPLDGYRILELILKTLFNKGLKYSHIVSILSLFIFLIYSININSMAFIIISIVLFIKNIEMKKNYDYLYLKSYIYQ